MVCNKTGVHGVVSKPNFADPTFYGATTDTATTTIDNENNIISVDVNIKNLLGNDSTSAYPGDLGQRNSMNIEKVAEKLENEINRAKEEEVGLTQDLFNLRDYMYESETQFKHNIEGVSTSLNNKIEKTEVELYKTIDSTEDELYTAIDNVKVEVEENLTPKLDKVSAELDTLEKKVTTDIQAAINDVTNDIDAMTEEFTNEVDSLKARDADLMRQIHLLHPLVFQTAPKFLNGGSSLATKGTTTSRTVQWSFNKPVDRVFVNDEEVTFTNIKIEESSSVVTYEYGWANIDENNSTLSIRGEVDNPKQTATSSIKVTFTYDVFYGAAVDIENESDLSKLENRLSTTKAIGEVTVNVSSGKYFYFCCPETYGIPKFFVGGFEGGVSEYRRVSVDRYGDSTEYVIYKSEQSDLGNTTFKIS